jgi:hypothetical protein
MSSGISVKFSDRLSLSAKALCIAGIQIVTKGISNLDGAMTPMKNKRQIRFSSNLLKEFFFRQEEQMNSQKCNFFNLSIASKTFSLDAKAENLKYPSPDGPNPEPGVPTTLASFRILSNKSHELMPFPELAQT